jgi:phage tail sheath protein FI
MAERTFKSPGVRAFEIDRSGPTPTGPSGVPAGVIGTAQEGPAFVPVTVSNFSEFEAKFGFLSGDQFGPIAAQEWLRNSGALTYVRVLGAGNAKRRSTSDGTVTNAGFVVGAELPLGSGLIGANSSANENGPLGRTYFLGCYMSESAGSTIFSDAGIQTSGDNEAAPILRGVVMAPSGVVLRVSCSNAPGGIDNDPSATDASSASVGAITGTINFVNGSPKFTMLLVGHKGANDPRVITASFNPSDKDYFGNTLNKDPLKIETAGHLLYTHYDVYPEYAVVTGSGITPSGSDMVNSAPSPQATYSGSSDAVFITTGTQDRNAGATASPNYEGFNERFRAARTPFMISQKFGGTAKDLFRVHLLSDGVLKGKNSDSVGSNTKYKVSIENVGKSSDPLDKFGSFDLVVRDFYDDDENTFVYEAHRGLNLDPTSTNYVARRIGDLSTFYDFDQAQGAQKLVAVGKYPNVSARIRVEMASEVDNGDIDQAALPLGFRGLDHLLTSGSQGLAVIADGLEAAGGGRGPQINPNVVLRGVVQPPVPLRKNLAMGLSPKQVPNKSLYWGVQLGRKTLLNEPNKSSVVDGTIPSFTKFFPDYAVSNLNVITGSNAGQTDENGFRLDCDAFNNNIFTLENVKVGTGSNGLAITTDGALVNSWSYVRNGDITTDAGAKTRRFSVNDTASPAVRRLAKFTTVFQQGFDGVDVFNADSAALNNKSAKGEMDDSNRGGVNGSTVAAHKKALAVMGEKADVDIQLLAIPGIRQSTITNDGITTVEDRFDALYLMDVEERDAVNNVVTSSVQSISVSNTVSAFNDRALDSSFAAAYFPDLNMNVQVKTLNTATKTVVANDSTLRVPPSVAVLGAFSFNDAVAFPWFAPAGFARGSMNAQSVSVRLNEDNLDDLYDKDINPIVTFPNSAGPIVFGQKTLQAAASALDRVNVRRLLIDVRRSVKQVAQQLIFEPNREATLQRFTALVTPIMKRVQQNQGIDRFKVIIDSSTTTQADVENNTVRGKIFLQPTRTAEFISLDFVVTNSGVNGL